MALTKLQMSQLFSVYGNLLTQKQRDVVAMFCDCDCTLSEIAQEQGISRQGVRDAVVKAENTFVRLEQTLGLAQFSKQVSAAILQGDKEQVVRLANQYVNKE